jgi:hypothetical protein
MATLYREITPIMVYSPSPKHGHCVMLVHNGKLLTSQEDSRCYYGDQIRDGEMGGKCSKHRVEKNKKKTIPVTGREGA